MNPLIKLAAGLLLLLGVAAGGYWFGTKHTVEEQGSRSATKSERTILYYRNPMGLPDTSPTPKKDAMGMDYVPVYADEEQTSGQIAISANKVQKLGVKSEAAAMRELDRTLHVTGRIETDERRTYTIAPKFEGWVERLYVNATGQAVGKGQPLFDVYSPDLVTAQREHALALQGLAALKDADEEAKRSMQQLVTASAARLRNWDVEDAQSTAPASGEGRANVTFRAPVNGIVLDKKAVQGMRFMPGEMLYQIADLSSVWVIADLPEENIGQVQLGSQAQVTVDAYPGRTFPGRVNFIYPTLDAATRTVKVRIEMPNPKGLLKPAMFANTQINVANGNKVLTVPLSAVIDSGIRQVVLVRLAEGRFEPRTVKLGSRSDEYAEVLEGVTAGEQVVTSANFLLDSESNLKSALSGFGAATQSKPGADVSVGHQARGTLEAINNDGTVSITHEPIASLGWPGMTMDFAVTNSSLVAGIRPGTAITFEIVERKPGEWVITKVQAQARAQHRHEGH